jgi:hypothetical protein
MATAKDLRKRITDSLLEEIREVQYPSTTMLDRVEPALGPQELSDYVEVLVEKIEATKYPSISLLNRLEGLLGQLEQFEQQQQRQQEESDNRERKLQAA